MDIGIDSIVTCMQFFNIQFFIPYMIRKFIKMKIGCF